MKVIGVLLLIVLILALFNPDMDSFIEYVKTKMLSNAEVDAFSTMMAPVYIRSMSRVDDYFIFTVVTMRLKDEDGIFLGIMGQWIFLTRRDLEDAQ